MPIRRWSFIILKDNIRNNAKETLEYFKKQDVKVKIISGDNPITVSNLLKQLNIDDYDKYISGQDLPDNYNNHYLRLPTTKRSIL